MHVYCPFRSSHTDSNTMKAYGYLHCTDLIADLQSVVESNKEVGNWRCSCDIHCEVITKWIINTLIHACIVKLFLLCLNSTKDFWKYLMKHFIFLTWLSLNMFPIRQWHQTIIRESNTLCSSETGDTCALLHITICSVIMKHLSFGVMLQFPPSSWETACFICVNVGTIHWPKYYFSQPLWTYFAFQLLSLNILMMLTQKQNRNNILLKRRRLKSPISQWLHDYV